VYNNNLKKSFNRVIDSKLCIFPPILMIWHFFEGNLVFKDHDTDTHNDEALKMLNLANMDEDDFFDED
jgi:hypothetical protein